MLPGVEPCAASLIDGVAGIVVGSRAPLVDSVASHTVVGSGSG